MSGDKVAVGEIVVDPVQPAEIHVQPFRAQPDQMAAVGRHLTRKLKPIVLAKTDLFEVPGIITAAKANRAS